MLWGGLPCANENHHRSGLATLLDETRSSRVTASMAASVSSAMGSPCGLALVAAVVQQGGGFMKRD